mmetsp:Transcript_16653/g.25692  ORF Transcript_16653/g.25692 Transcript_16653/m.25692 type:complete len:224 (-) Transcript_16653:303-974(-)
MRKATGYGASAVENTQDATRNTTACRNNVRMATGGIGPGACRNSTTNTVQIVASGQPIRMARAKLPDTPIANRKPRRSRAGLASVGIRQPGHHFDVHAADQIQESIVVGVDNHIGLPIYVEAYVIRFVTLGVAWQNDAQGKTLRIAQPAVGARNFGGLTRLAFGAVRTCGAQAGDLPFEDFAGMHVEHYIHRITFLDVAEVVFGQVSLDPNIGRIDESHQALA